MSKDNQKASLKISQDVVETIARIAALEVEGVADIDETEGWLKHPITIRITDGVAEVGLQLVLKFGAQIGDVCEKVQQSVKENIQTMTGIMVSKVHIAVEDIKLPEPKAKELSPTT